MASGMLTSSPLQKVQLPWHAGCRVESNDGLGGLEFEEDEAMGCKYTRYTRRQVLQCMENRSIVFLGDSMVRRTDPCPYTLEPIIHGGTCCDA